MSEYAVRITTHRVLKSTYVRHFATTLMGEICVVALGALSSVLAARLLGPKGRGELAALSLWPSTLTYLGSLGVGASIVFHTGKQRYDPSKIWTASTILGAIQSSCVVLLGFLIIPHILHQYPSGVRNLALVILVAAPVFTLGGLPGFLLQGRMEITSYNLTRMTTPFFYSAGLGILVWLHAAFLGGVVACQILSVGATMALGLGLLFAKLKPRFDWDRPVCLSLFKYGLKNHLSNVSSFLNQRLDQLLLSLFVAPRDLGLYVVAVAVASAVSFFPQAAGIVTLATGSNLDPEHAKKVIARSFRLSLVWLVLVCALLVPLIPWFITVVFGPAFAGSVLACRILLPGTIALGLNRVLYDGASALGQPILPSYAEGIAMVVTVLGLYFLLPRFGFVGAAMVSSAAYVSGLAFILGLFRSRLQIGVAQLLGVSSASSLDQEG